MRRNNLLLTVLAALCLAFVGSVGASDSQTLNGEYFWDQGDSRGDIEAVFSSRGEGEWDVAFHFKFRDEEHVYKGTAKGSLELGGLQGEVQNENKRRTFRFEGSFANGSFEGTHSEIGDGEEFRTGTLTMQ
jgi:hypothetical protein